MGFNIPRFSREGRDLDEDVWKVCLYRYNTVSLDWERWDGKIDTVVSGDLNVAVDNLEQYILDTLNYYKFSDWLVDGTNIYIGYLEKGGAWYIKKIDTSAHTVRYIKGASGYTFAAPALLSYDDFATEF